jgi:FkbM family methyltransferase
MRKIFIDCGYYRGRAITQFKETPDYDDSFEIFAFDPNRFSDEKLAKIKESGVSFINKAVWTFDGEIKFYASGKQYGQANSIFPNPSKPRREKTRTVKCIDFGKWVIENFSKDDHIIIKMDIEGAEYDILQSMLKDGSLHYADIMYIEYHYHRIDGITGVEFSALRNKLEAETEVNFRKAIEW